jgi:hypothetical protein
MGLFDTYIPAKKHACPVCGTLIESTWQGHDGPCALFVFKENIAGAVDQDVDGDIEIHATEREKIQLPEKFLIHTHDCDCPHFTVLRCTATDGVWQKTELHTGSQEDRKQGKQTRARWKAYLHWLESEK